MRKKQNWTAVLGVVAATVIVAVISIPNIADGHIMIEGVVCDEHGQRLRDAQVSISRPGRSQSVVADAHGKFFVASMTSPYAREWKLVIDAPKRKRVEKIVLSPRSYSVHAVIPLSVSDTQPRIAIIPWH